MRKNCGHTKIRRLKCSSNARAPRYFATAAQPAASKRRSLWPLTRLPSIVAGRFATLSPGRRCRRTASLTAFPDFRETVAGNGSGFAGTSLGAALGQRRGWPATRCDPRSEQQTETAPCRGGKCASGGHARAEGASVHRKASAHGAPCDARDAIAARMGAAMRITPC